MTNKLLFFYIICNVIYNMRIFVHYKTTFKELYNSLEIINLKIENIGKFINRRKVSFGKEKTDCKTLNNGSTE